MTRQEGWRYDAVHDRLQPVPTSSRLAAALVKAQAELPAVEPNATNPHFKSRFVTLDHLIGLTRPVLNRHGLAIVQLPSIGPAGEPALTTTIVHESGETIEQQMLLLAAKVDPQGQGAALTYARRYAWAAALGISAEVDDDGNTASGKTPPTGEAASPRQPHPVETLPGEEDLPDALKSDPSTQDWRITEPQRKRLWVIKSQRGMTDETFRELLIEHTGQGSTREIRRRDYRALSAAVEAWEPLDVEPDFDPDATP